MRILHIAFHLDQAAAGVSTAVAGMSSSIRMLSNKLEVFGLRSKQWDDTDSDQWRGAPASAFKQSNILKGFGYAPSMYRAIHKYKPDIVHVHGLWMYPAIAAYRWHLKTKKPYVISPHGMLMPHALNIRKRKKYLARKLYQDRILLNASRIIATSEEELESIRRLGFHSHVVNIPLGIDFQELPDTCEGEASDFVLYVGRLHPQKGIDRLIEAWGHVEKSCPGWSLRLVGPAHSSYLEHLKNLSSVLGVERVQFLGPRYDEDKFEIMASAGVVVLPTYGENFGYTVPESLLMKTPVIATKSSPWRGLVDNECGWWIEPSIDGLSQAIKEAVEVGGDRRAELGQNGRSWVISAFSWSECAVRTLAMYNDVIAQDNSFGVVPV